jgi:hypothetical protein
MGTFKSVAVLDSLALEKKERLEVLKQSQKEYDDICQRSVIFIKLRSFFGFLGNVLWASKQVVFGILICVSFSFFGTVNLPNFSFKIFNNPPLIVSVDAIVENAPKDEKKREIISNVFLEVADHIDTGVLTSRDEVVTSIKMGIPAVIANKDWYSTVDAIESLLNQDKELKKMSETLKEIAGKINE